MEEYIKDFDGWNTFKKELEDTSPATLFKEQEIWWCAIGINVGSESCGKGEFSTRPILVLKKLSAYECIGLPVSNEQKTGSWFIDITIHTQKQYILLHQIRLFSTRRFQRRLTTLNNIDFLRVKEKLEQLLELSSHNHQSESLDRWVAPKT